jgi:hypothetical protein
VPGVHARARRRAGLIGAVLLAVIAALAAVSGAAGAAGAARAKHRTLPPVWNGGAGVPPRIGGAMGIIPAHGHFDLASGEPIDAVYHGGGVMGPSVTIHTVFWAPAGYAFGGSPGPEPTTGLTGLLGTVGVPSSPQIPGYEALQQQFFADVAHDSGSQSNVFALLGQYRDRTGAGGYQLGYDPATDSINDTNPYPARAHQCASPSGDATCLTDNMVTRELDKVIAAHGSTGSGMHDVWFIYLPPGVDECYQATACGTNAFAGYHSLANLGHSPVVYAVIIDPLIEFTPPAGSDPQGNPAAESAIDTAGHELFEALTDPVGVGWMDPNGNELADKCENGPQIATPLGYAPDGAPYDQVINGHAYLIQGMWSNAVGGCIDRVSTPSTTPPPSLPLVSMTQFSPDISGNIGSPHAGIKVAVLLTRAQQPVAGVQSVTRADGSWGPVALRSFSPHGVHAFGDDRDGVLVAYSGAGPKVEAIGTGSGGNPFTEAGWTGWYDLDTGVAVGTHAVQVAPCSQVGLLDVRVGGTSAGPLVDQCSFETGTATARTRTITLSTHVTLTSTDNRAIAPNNEAGALVGLTVPLGEPNSVGFGFNNQVMLLASGMPTCNADLRSQAVVCTGLVPGERYTVIRRRGGSAATVRTRADFIGALSLKKLPGPVRVRGGDVIALRNAVGRQLTALHVAHLRVAINGTQTAIASGTCEPGNYWGKPVQQPPLSKQVLFGGIAGTGTICPLSGHAKGLPDDLIEQTDDRSGGLTRTSVPLLEGSSPSNDATVYGGFTALAQTGLPTATNGVYAGGARVSVTITRAGSPKTVAFRSANVDTARGVPVPALGAGVYAAKWVVSDINGDTRTVHTRFVEV